MKPATTYFYFCETPAQDNSAISVTHLEPESKNFSLKGSPSSEMSATWYLICPSFPRPHSKMMFDTFCLLSRTIIYLI